jgi:glycosyltransferase involved in cell wall biosynthesis
MFGASRSAAAHPRTELISTPAATTRLFSGQRSPAGRPGSRIVILVENLPVPPDRRVWQEARALQRAGHKVTVICPKGKGWTKSRETIDGVEILRHALPQATSAIGYFGEYAVALVAQSMLTWRVFLRSGIDVIQCCNPPDLLFLVAAQFKPFGVRFMFDHHDLAPELFAVKFPKARSGLAVMRWLERVTFGLADHVMCTNEAFRAIAIERGRKSPACTDVVLSSPEFLPAMAVPPDPALRNHRAHAVLYVGVMGSQDGVDLLLQAAHHIVHVQRRDDVQFLLAGDGPEKPALIARADELGLTAHVSFLGFVTGVDLWRALRTADLGVCPDPKNPFNDNLTMNKLLEYMAFGVPLVAFDLAVSQQIVGGAGCFVRGNDPLALALQMTRLLDAPAERAALAERGLERFAQLSWPRQEARLLAAYTAIVAPRAAEGVAWPKSA